MYKFALKFVTRIVDTILCYRGNLALQNEWQDMVVVERDGYSLWFVGWSLLGCKRLSLFLVRVRRVDCKCAACKQSGTDQKV